MKYLSVCSGIEAATVAWHHMGWEPVAFSEIEKFPSQVLAHHYPAVPNWGDMTKFKEWPDADVDVLVGGTPCQSFSVAGLRKGLADPRGNLMLTYLAIAAKYRPKWLVWENVPGVLSSGGGRDFASLLRGMGELGYGFAYRILDAQYFGVAQRRRRVFVVGCIGNWQRAAAVLFERHSLWRHPAPSRKAWKDTSGGAPAGTGVGVNFYGGNKRVDRPEGGFYVKSEETSKTLDSATGLNPTCSQGGTAVLTPTWPADVAPTLDSHYGDKQGLENQHINGGGGCSLPEVSLCLNAGGMGRQDAESETLIPIIGGGFDVAHTLRGEGFDASEDGTGRGTPLVPVAFTRCDNGQDAQINVTPTMRCGSNYSAHLAVAFNHQAGGTQTTLGYDQDSGTAPTLNKSQTAAVAFESRFARNGRGAPSDVVPPLKAQSGETGKGDAAPLVMAAMQVRRLTPVECERLQGFPDGYTDIKPNGKQTADGPRYKALGNSMAVPCMVWIGERIAAVEAISQVEEVAA